MRNGKRIATAAGLLAAAFLAPPPVGATTNVITDLGTLGGPYSEAWAVNDLGQVAGSSSTAGGAIHAFLHSGGVMTDLGTLGGMASWGRGINGVGDVVGTAELPAGNAHAVLWSGGTPTDLGTLGGFTSIGYDINDAGQIVGEAYTASGFFRPFLYSGGTMMDLGSLGGVGGSAGGINAAGEVVGYSDTGLNYRAFLYSGVMSDLGSLFAASTSSVARAVNASGDAAGEATTVDDETHAVSFAGGAVTDLGTPPKVSSTAYDINDAGQIVGASFGSAALVRALIYNAGLPTDLNELLPPGSGWVLHTAGGISNAGHIVGWGNLNGGPSRAFLLTLGAGCGNGLLDGGESCDDGDTTAGDGCSAVCAVEAAWQCDGQPSLCRMSDQPLDGVKVIMRRSPRGEKLLFLSKDPDALFPAPGGPDDPTVVGAAIDVFTDTEWAVTYDLPAGNWRTSGGGLSHKFVNLAAPDAVSSVRVVTLRQGAVLRFVARAIPLDFDHLPGTVGIRVRAGSRWNCTRFGPATIVQQQPVPTVALVARGALASGVADCSAASLR